MSYYYSSAIYRKRNEIQWLYLTSKLPRKKFELTVLSAVFWEVIFGFFYTVPLFIIGFIITSKFFVSVDLFLILSVVLSYYTVTLIMIYILWVFMIRNRDYDTIKESGVIKT